MSNPNQGYYANILQTDNDISLAYTPNLYYYNSSPRYRSFSNQTFFNNGILERDSTINMLKEQLNKKNDSIQRNQDKI